MYIEVSVFDSKTKYSELLNLEELKDEYLEYAEEDEMRDFSIYFGEFFGNTKQARALKNYSYGWLESLCQSDNCPPFLANSREENFLILKHVEADYVKR